MGVDQETVPLLPKIKYAGNLQNPFGEELLHVSRMLNLASPKTALDIPCGQGGVSVYLAREYGITVDGYDLLQGFIDNTNQYAAEHHVQTLCSFFADDIRAAVAAGREYDLVLWSAAPHLWGTMRQTIEQLRKSAKHTGYIVIADAYTYTDAPHAIPPGYETLEEIRGAVAACGDTVVKLVDYKETLWAKSYRADREAVIRAIHNVNDQKEKAGLEQYLEAMCQSEASDLECLGLYILVLQVGKTGPPTINIARNLQPGPRCSDRSLQIVVCAKEITHPHRP